MAGKRVIEFEVTRRPEIRVFCQDFRRSTVQWLGEKTELRMFGEVPVLWGAWRSAPPIVNESYAEYALQLLLSQGMNLASLDARDERRASDIIRITEELQLSNDLRELMERRLRTLDGEERTARMIRDRVELVKREILPRGGRT